MSGVVGGMRGDYPGVHLLVVGRMSLRHFEC